MSEEEKNNVERTLFLLGKCYLCDGFYLELLMITDGLPKSYLVKQDANFEGVKVISVETPFKQRISDFLQKNDDFGPISQG